MKKLRFNFIIVFICLGFFAKAQGIVDDSTKADIGFDRTFYFTKEDIYKGDTTLKSLSYESRFDFFQHNFIDSSLQQNLGIYGSAGRLFLHDFNEELGNFDGISSFEYLAHQDKDVRYYDTQTPYSYLEYHRHFNGPQQFEGGYQRSHEDIASLGVNVRRITTPYNQGANTNSTLYLDNTAILVNGSYLAPSGKYNALINYRYMKQNMNENGGALIDTSITDIDDLIIEDFVTVNLTNVDVQEKRNEWSFYHEIRPFKNDKAKLFHSLDRTKKVNSYIDNSASTNSDYYTDTTLNRTSLQDSNVYRSITNQVGINGKLGPISYSGYLKNRWWRYTSDTSNADSVDILKRNASDNYIGGTLDFNKGVYKVSALAELGVDGTNKISFITDFKYLRFSFLNVVNRPTLRQQSWDAIGHRWENNFENTQVQDVMIQPYFSSKKIDVSGFVKLQSYKNHVYYSASSFIPTQDSVRRQVLAIGGSIEGRFKKFGFRQFTQYTDVGNTFYLPTPRLFSHTNVNLQLGTIKWLSALKGSIGADAFYFSSYKPLAYRADLQNFVVQDDLEEAGYLNVDAYLDLRYKTVQFSLKGLNLLQGLGGNDGYYPTAGFFGRRRGVELGLKWIFFG